MSRLSSLTLSTPYLNEGNLACLKEAGIKTVLDLVSLNDEVLGERVNIPFQDVYKAKKLLLFGCGAFPVKGRHFYEEALRNSFILSTGCNSLDDLLGGGLWTGEITEIVGPPALGKTQLCLTAAAHVAHEVGFNVLYIDVGSAFTCERLVEIIQSRRENCSSQVIEKALSKIHCLKIFDVFTLMNKLTDVQQGLSDKLDSFYHNLKLIVLDGVTPLIAPILGGGQTQGHSLMMQMGSKLKCLAEEFSLSVLVVNNVVSDWDSASTEEYKPALGRSWRTIPHVRLLIRQLEKQDGERKIILCKSSRQAIGRCVSFSLDQRGAVSNQ